MVLDPQYLDLVRGILQHHILLVELVVSLLELGVDPVDAVARHLCVMFVMSAGGNCECTLATSWEDLSQ